MKAIKSYDLFISHGWCYDLEYMQLVQQLNDEANFYWRNYSFPEFDTVIDPKSTAGKKRLFEELDAQIKYTEALIILAEHYTFYPKWIDYEIELANKYKKPIIVVKTTDGEQIQTNLQSNATELVRYNTNELVQCIRRMLD